MREKPTVVFCQFSPTTGELCHEEVKWKLESEVREEPSLKVCDQHLGWALRKMGLPARVDLPPEARNTIPPKTKT